MGKEKKYKILSCMCCVWLLMMFSSCEQGTVPENQTESTEKLTETAIDVEGVSLCVLAENGESQYVILRSDITNSNSPETKLSLQLQKAIQQATGTDLPLKTDWSPEKVVPEDGYEILLGKTNRPESAAAAEKLGRDEYLIQMVGNRLVIQGENEQALEAAVHAFMQDALGYDPEQHTYENTNLILPPDYEKRGDCRIVLEGREKALVSVTPPRYLLPSCTFSEGVYQQHFEAFDVTGCMTTFQTASAYHDRGYVPADSVMIYTTNEDTVKTWTEQEDAFNIDMMIAINRADLAWAEAHPASIQTRKNGSWMLHGSGASYYMTPTEEFIEYLWENVQWSLMKYRPVTIVFEEPEMWNESGYSEGFKKEWAAYFGEPWQAPHTSAEALFKSMKLKTYLFERVLVVMEERVHAMAPDTSIYIATHSTLNYNAWNITSGLNHYLATGTIDGVIGQTWSDTIRTAFPFRGKPTVDEFLNAYVDFASYTDSAEGTNFYALADPMCDSQDSTEQKNRYSYRQTVAAALMHPEIHRFEILPWLDRAFEQVSDSYRTILQQCFQALNEVGGQEITLEAGTPGIAYAVSDTVSWLKDRQQAPSSAEGVYGIMMPLAANGIPVGVRSMEHIRSAEDLKGVQVLIVSCDNQIPVQPSIYEAVSDWVREGGSLLLLSGQNYFWAEDENPVDLFLQELGIQASVVREMKSWKRTSLRGEEALLSAGKPYFFEGRFAITYDTELKPLLTLGEKTLAFEQEIGEGYVLAVGLPVSYYSTVRGYDLMRSLTERAVSHTKWTYTEMDYMSVRRGSVVAAHAFRKEKRLDGMYINLFDENLAIETQPVVPPKDSLLLYAVDLPDTEIPHLVFSGARILEDSLHETNEQTTFTCVSASDSMLSTRLFAPAGRYPEQVQAVCDGHTVDVSMVWNNEHASLLLKHEGNVQPTTITVTWCDVPMEDGRNVYYKEYEISVNRKGEDEPYLLVNTAYANDTLRYCDGTGQLVYKFDLSVYPEAVYAFTLAQNYIAEISADGENWTLAADYSQGGTVKHIHNADNMCVLSVKPDEYGCTDFLYFRLRNSDTSQGWGGTLSKIRIKYPVVEED